MSRRQFLKVTAAGALTLSAIPTLIVPRRVKAYQPGGRIHPHIDPLRVVGVRDPRMATAVKESCPWQEQEGLVAWDFVQESMDKMACALAGEASPADAWKKVFVQPPGKSWSDVVVAIKVNNLGEQHVHSVVLGKVCHVLTDVIGVKGSNVYVYDAVTGGGMAKNTPFKGLPDGVTVADQWGWFSGETVVPTPYFDGTRTAKCLGHLANGEVDVLVNVGTCKGHDGQFGGFTLTMKNHFGTFDPQLGHQQGGGLDYLLAINKSELVLGPVDAQTGDVLFPRQQLCVLDALWGSDPGPGCMAMSQPNALTMGVFGPAIDYVTAMRLRKDVMGWRVNEEAATRFLTEFGFQPEGLPNGGQIVDALAVSV